MTSVLEEAKALEGDIIADRRWLHEHPEIGFDLPQTTAYVAERLREIGLEPEEIVPGGLVATIGDPSAGRCFMLRADMDALPIKEETGLPFASPTDYMHACGHDTHTAMLLGAAQLRCLPRGALILDLASRPGGTDFAAARELGLRAEHALSLPARCAPETAGALVAHTVEVILQERAATARSERGVS